MRTLPEVTIVEELLAGWCVMPATEARGISSGPSSILAATVSPPSHGQSPQDGMAPFTLSLISHFKSLLLSWHKSLPAHWDARHLRRAHLGSPGMASQISLSQNTTQLCWLPAEHRFLTVLLQKTKIVWGCATYLKHHTGSKTSQWEGVGKKKKKS